MLKRHKNFQKIAQNVLDKGTNCAYTAINKTQKVTIMTAIVIQAKTDIGARIIRAANDYQLDPSSFASGLLNAAIDERLKLDGENQRSEDIPASTEA